MGLTGADIRRIREALHLSQIEFGMYFGVREGAVRRWETDRRIMRWSSQELLLNLLRQEWVRAKLAEAGLLDVAA